MGISWKSVAGFFSDLASCCKRPAASTSTPLPPSPDGAPGEPRQNLPLGDSAGLLETREPPSPDRVPIQPRQDAPLGYSTELPEIREPSQLNRFIQYIEGLLASLKKKHDPRTAASTSNTGADFSRHMKYGGETMEKISSEAEKFKSSTGDLTSKLSEEARRIVTDALKGLGNLHWIGVAFSIVAFVLDTMHKCSSNVERCIQLLEEIVELGKILQQISEKTSDDETKERLMKAVHTIVDGAIICCYYIHGRTLFKYLTAQTVEESLRGTHDSLHDLKSDLTILLEQLTLRAIENIQNQLSHRLPQRRNILQISDPVGLEEPFDEVKELLNMESNGAAKAVIIYGFGGVGKTTLAEYTVSKLKLDDFKLCVIRIDEQSPNIRRLQEQILSDVGGKKIDLRDYIEGRDELKNALKDQVCFFLIDNVVDKYQVSELLPRELCLSPRSRILITSRKSDVKEVLPHNMEWKEYHVQPLPEEKSVELLQKTVLANRQGVTSDEERKIEDLAEACGGVPLLLSVFGSHIRVDSSESAYEEALRSLKEGEQGRYVEEGLSRRLLSVYHHMKNADVKDAFVDICTLFHGRRKGPISSIVGEYELKLLQEGALVNITESERVVVHDVLRSFGISEGRTTRLRGTADELLSALNGDEELKRKIHGFWISNGHLYSGFLNKMSKSLRTLNLGDGTVLQGQCPGQIFRELRFLKLGNLPSFPFKDASKFEKLAVLHCDSEAVLKSELDGLPQSLKHLKLISPSKGAHLVHRSWWRHINDLTNLQELKLANFNSLPEQLVLPETLRRLELKDCQRLKNLPQGFGRLTSLKHLTVKNCPELERVSTEFERLVSLKSLTVIDCPMFERQTAEELEERAEEFIRRFKQHLMEQPPQSWASWLADRRHYLRVWWLKVRFG